MLCRWVTAGTGHYIATAETRHHHRLRQLGEFDLGGNKPAAARDRRRPVAGSSPWPTRGLPEAIRGRRRPEARGLRRPVAGSDRPGNEPSGHKHGHWPAATARSARRPASDGAHEPQGGMHGGPP